MLGVGVIKGRKRNSIEARGSRDGVGSHVLENQPITNLQQGKVFLLGDAVHGITGGTPKAALEDLLLPLFLGFLLSVEEELALPPHNLRKDLGVIEEEAVEGTVNPVAKIIHVRGRIPLGRSRNGAARDNVDSKGKGSSGHIPSWLGNDAHVGREMLVKGIPQAGSDVLEGSSVHSVKTRKASSDIKEIKLESKFLGLIKYVSGHENSIGKGGRIKAAASHVEGDSDHVQVKVTSEGEKIPGDRRRGSKLDSEAADRARIVSKDAQDELGIRVEFLNLLFRDGGKRRKRWQCEISALVLENNKGKRIQEESREKKERMKEREPCAAPQRYQRSSGKHRSGKHI